VILVTRGNGPTANKPEDPGALKVFDYNDGLLSNQASIAPGGGFDFKPRHLDFHPSKPWIFVSLERQHKLQVYERRKDDGLNPAPLYTVESLLDPSHAPARQNAGTLHIHPNGRFLYQANRAVEPGPDGRPAFTGGENSIAVYEIDQNTGKPDRIQNIDTRGAEPRTFALDPGGRILIAGNQVAVAKGPNGSAIPISMAVFRVRPDGKLEYLRKYDLDAGSGKSLFWMGLVALP
jgi:6-phosphogluconolactonase (cycloisomerase 2 family)